MTARTKVEWRVVDRKSYRTVWLAYVQEGLDVYLMCESSVGMDNEYYHWRISGDDVCSPPNLLDARDLKTAKHEALKRAHKILRARLLPLERAVRVLASHLAPAPRKRAPPRGA